ncbi:hypothetical protein MDOR_33270 [Mycolicibacterium doricum]|uniref:Alpha/beta hydrolase n=1 Tax=Mycolicibacterium doricum TaxID=126673 RepID=A0A7I7W016_9MYCO|nr:hypothetical protein MDOR_33270 [Mycolicibacterium doricum]
MARRRTGRPPRASPAHTDRLGPYDGYLPEQSARAYRRDLPDAQCTLIGGGHWLLETHLDEVAPMVDDSEPTADDTKRETPATASTTRLGLPKRDEMRAA